MCQGVQENIYRSEIVKRGQHSGVFDLFLVLCYTSVNETPTPIKSLLRRNSMREVIVAPTQEEIKEVIDIKPKTLDKLIIKANDIALNSNDYTVRKASHHNVRFNDTAGLTFIAEDQEIRDFPISRYALGQLGSKIGVPARYLEKCITSGRIDLAQDNVNSWLEDFNKDLFVREYNGGIRGILSSKYSVCDSHEILGVINDAVDLSKYKIKGSYLNEERLHLRLVSTEMLPIDGEDLFAGLFVDSSDVGRSILTVKFGIYKQVCTNGLVIARASGTLFEQKHIGISADEFHEGLVASLNNVDLLTEHAVEWVTRAKNRLNHWSVECDYEDEIKEFVAYIRQQTNLSDESAHKVIDLMRNRYEDTRWGLINSITEVAQDFTLERRLELERIAGNMLVA